MIFQKVQLIDEAEGRGIEIQPLIDTSWPAHQDPAHEALGPRQVVPPTSSLNRWHVVAPNPTIPAFGASARSSRHVSPANKAIDDKVNTRSKRTLRPAQYTSNMAVYRKRQRLQCVRPISIRSIREFTLRLVFLLLEFDLSGFSFGGLDRQRNRRVGYDRRFRFARQAVLT